jgi:tRNA G18 (ribose-2'-O)-methylase SpoU
VSIRERDLTRGHGARFIVEGKVTLETLLTRSRFEIESLFLSETRLGPLADSLTNVPPNLPIYTAPQAIMDEIAGFPIHRGILACGLKGSPHDIQHILGEDSPAAPHAYTQKRSVILMLSGISNHDNVGACFRNAAAFGASGVLLDDQSCDPLYRKAIRVSSGASLWLPFAHENSTDAHIAAAKAAGYTIWALTPRTTAVQLRSAPIPDKLVILLGPEGPGLSDAHINAATPIRIPMAAGFDSLNVATAGAIALAHVCDIATEVSDEYVSKYYNLL